MPSLMPPRRLPSGRLSRAKRAADMQNEDNARDVAEAQSVVLAQPHRRGNSDQMCESPYGRFIIAYALEREIYDSCVTYSITLGKYYAGIGAPRDETHEGSGGEIPDELQKKRRDDSAYWFSEMVYSAGVEAADAVKTMCLNYDITQSVNYLNVCSALRALARATGHL